MRPGEVRMRPNATAVAGLILAALFATKAALAADARVSNGRSGASIAPVALESQPKCTGDACDGVWLYAGLSPCVWARTTGVRYVAQIALALKLADRTVQFLLKTPSSYSRAEEPPDIYDSHCYKVERSLRAEYAAETEGGKYMEGLTRDEKAEAEVAKCHQEEALREAQDRSDEYYDNETCEGYGCEYPVYHKKLITPSGCIQALQDIRSFTANLQPIKPAVAEATSKPKTTSFYAQPNNFPQHPPTTVKDCNDMSNQVIAAIAGSNPGFFANFPVDKILPQMCQQQQFDQAYRLGSSLEKTFWH
jgi:hypothetical protein